MTLAELLRAAKDGGYKRVEILDAAGRLVSALPLVESVTDASLRELAREDARGYAGDVTYRVRMKRTDDDDHGEEVPLRVKGSGDLSALDGEQRPMTSAQAMGALVRLTIEQGKQIVALADRVMNRDTAEQQELRKLNLGLLRRVQKNGEIDVKRLELQMAADAQHAKDERFARGLDKVMALGTALAGRALPGHMAASATEELVLSFDATQIAKLVDVCGGETAARILAARTPEAFAVVIVGLEEGQIAQLMSLMRQDQGPLVDAVMRAAKKTAEKNAAAANGAATPEAPP